MNNRKKYIDVGLFIPTSGDAGVWGPSCWACAKLATEEINSEGGIAGSMIKLHLHDAGRNPITTALVAKYLVDTKAIDVIVGMHTSDIREEICRHISNKIPYIYTPLWEGGVQQKRTLCIGETPDQQLAPSFQWLSERYKLNSWYLVGHDYVWPRVTNRWLKESIRGRQQKIVAEKYSSFEVTDFSRIIDDIKLKKPDAVLVSLVGDGSVQFNRQFGRSGLSGKVVRLSTAVEENMLLAIGDTNTEALFSSAGYFACLKNSRNGGFWERYHSRFGEYSPPLNAIGHSVYEGIHLLKEVFSDSSSIDSKIPLPSVRNGQVQFGKGSEISSLFLAEAQGMNFEIVKEFNDIV